MLATDEIPVTTAATAASRLTVTVDAKARFFRGFSDPSRLRIMEALVDGPLSVSEITEAAGLSQSNTSNHLACLLGCGLVEREQRGRFAYYRPADDRVAVLLALAEQLVGGAGERLEPCAHCGSGSA